MSYLDLLAYGVGAAIVGVALLVSLGISTLVMLSVFFAPFAWFRNGFKLQWRHWRKQLKYCDRCHCIVPWASWGRDRSKGEHTSEYCGDYHCVNCLCKEYEERLLDKETKNTKE